MDNLIGDGAHASGMRDREDLPEDGHPCVIANTFVLLKPDVVLRGIVRSALALIEGLGMRIIVIGARRMRKGEYARVYGRDFECFVDGWDYNAGIYDHGPTVGVLLARSAGSDQALTATEIMAGEKGKALPREWTETCIRTRLSATSRVCNAIHVFDTAEGALTEAGVWFGSRIVREGCFGRSEVASAQEWANNIDDHGYGSGAACDGHVTLCYVRIRILDSILCRIFTDSLVAKQLRRVRAMSVDHVHALRGSVVGGGSRRVVLQRIMQDDEVTITALTRERSWREADVEAGIATKTLEAMEQVLRGELEWSAVWGAFRYAMDIWGVYASSLEMYLMEGALRYAHTY